MSNRGEVKYYVNSRKDFWESSVRSKSTSFLKDLKKGKYLSVDLLKNHLNDATKLFLGWLYVKKSFDRSDG